MRDLPKDQLNPKIKNVWRINDAIWLTVAFLCLFIPFLIALIVESAPWIGITLAAIAALYVIGLIVWLVILPPIRFVRWR